MNIANKISLFRILSVPVFIACLHYSSEHASLRLVAFFVFVIAVFSDAIDGYIARKTKQKSKAGLVLDPLADKLLLLSAFVVLYLMKEISFWVILIVITRDALILIGSIVIYIVKQEINVYPSWWGKFTTMFQMLFVSIVLLQWPLIADKVLLLAVAFTVISGADYLRRGFNILYVQDTAAKNQKNA